MINPPCPFLPEIDRVYRATDVTSLGKDRSAAFVAVSLRYAQSQWQAGLPAQAMLQVNRVLSCAIPTEAMPADTLAHCYQTMAFLMRDRQAGQFIGNPRRHFQHLATRMVPPHAELRTWRAWACWYLAKGLLPEAEYPGDAKQIRDEAVIEPCCGQIDQQLRQLSPADDSAAWHRALGWAGVPRPISAEAHITEIGPERLDEVRALAHSIWPQVYPLIISEAQINYMLEQRYAIAVLHADIASGVRYALIERQGIAIGYIAVQPMEDHLFLHKLYLEPQFQGQGIGSRALQWTATVARDRGLRSVRLRVNKSNATAIRAYRRAGFNFTEDIVTDIGAGFVVDDYELAIAIA
jgi:ribosomal protein S18 acetylase RimI-like enzyme